MEIEIIVTGGAGFIGRNLVAELNRRGREAILVVDSLGVDEKWRNLVGLRYEDYMDKALFREAMWQQGLLDEVAVVFHLGACSSTTETDANYLVDNNYAYSREVCTWCLERGVRFIYASSAATYGDGSLGYSDSDDVTPMLEPLNMYGYSKQMFDLWALQNGLFDGIVGLKYFNVYGPHEDHKSDMRSVINKAYSQILDMGEIQLFESHRPEYGDGEQKRDFMWVNDAVEQTLWFLDRPDVSGLFNCGSGTARTWNDLARAMFVAMNRKAAIRYIGMPGNLAGKYQYFTEADMRKVRAVGYTAAPTSLEEGIRQYIENFLVHGGAPPTKTSRSHPAP